MYLLHFEQGIPARPGGRPALVFHYMGFTDHLARRYRHHLAGNGSRLVAAVAARGIPVHVVRTWDGTRNLERTLKRRHQLSGLCPTCRRVSPHRGEAMRCPGCGGMTCRRCTRHLYVRGRSYVHARRIGCRVHAIPKPWPLRPVMGELVPDPAWRDA